MRTEGQLTVEDHDGGALLERAAHLDAHDPLAHYRDLFIGTDTELSYLDGNSLGRPLKRTITDISTFIQDCWGGRLIRGWDEEWLALPQAIGDQLGRPSSPG
jgi:kynureninase